MMEIILILILLILIFIFKIIKKFWDAYHLLNFSIHTYQEIKSLQKDANWKKENLTKEVKKQGVDYLSNTPEDVKIKINGKTIPYFPYLGVVQKDEKYYKILIETNLKATAGFSKIECTDYFNKRLKEEKIY